MLRQTNRMRCVGFRGLTAAAAIGCWLTFVNSARADDGPALVPQPAAASEVDLPPPALPPLEPIPEPDTESVEITVPTLGASSDLPVLKTPAAKPAEKKQDTTKPEESDTEFVTIRTRKKTADATPTVDAGPSLQGPLLSTSEPLLVPPTPKMDAVNNPFPAGQSENNAITLTPIETQYSVPSQSTPGQLDRLIEKMVLEAVPSRYKNDSEWGKKKTITSGINIGLKGLFLKTERQTKEVDHGEWKRFQIDRKSNSPSYTVKVKRLRMETDKQVRFSADYLVPVTTQAELLDFSRGIRLRSINASGVATVQLSVDVTINIEPVSQSTNNERAVVLYPIVNSAKLKLADFEPGNSSRFKGSTARELDSDTKQIVKHQLTKLGKGLAKSLNSQLKVDGYQIATNDLLNTKWGKMLASSTDKSVSQTR